MLRGITAPTRAVSHASWLYPLKVQIHLDLGWLNDMLTPKLQGIYYFCAHPFLWPLLRARLLPSALLSLFVLTNLFLWTYLPQVRVRPLHQGDTY